MTTTPNPAPVTTSDAERAAFEAWLPTYWNRETYTADDEESGKLYCEDWVQGAWAMWNHLRSTALRIDFKQATDQGGWQPIATAPRDGKPIILGFEMDEEYGGFVGQGRWHEEDHDGPDNMGHDAGFMDDQFDFFKCARSFGNPAYQHNGLQPTHWQPLPAAPTLQGVADGDAVGGKSGEKL